jgi:hypothetical protein
MYKQMTKFTMSWLPSGALTMTFVIYIRSNYLENQYIRDLSLKIEV